MTSRSLAVRSWVRMIHQLRRQRVTAVMPPWVGVGQFVVCPGPSRSRDCRRGGTSDTCVAPRGVGSDGGYLPASLRAFAHDFIQLGASSNDLVRWHVQAAGELCAGDVRALGQVASGR